MNRLAVTVGTIVKLKLTTRNRIASELQLVRYLLAIAAEKLLLKQTPPADPSEKAPKRHRVAVGRRQLELSHKTQVVFPIPSGNVVLAIAQVITDPLYRLWAIPI